jgi:polyisoprenoid-binding protein YceI
MRRRSCAALVVAAALLVACTAQAPRPVTHEEALPPGFPEAFYHSSAAAGAAVFAIDPASSLLVIEARRGGSLAHLGHDHVIAAHNLRGYVAPKEGRADLFFRLDELVVDEADLRAQAAFDTQPNAAAIAGTRDNMLTQLQAAEHPYAVIAVAGAHADAAGTVLQVSIALRGVTRTVQIPVQFEERPEQLTVLGRTSLEQTSFGIAPLSLLGGGLVVQDQVNVRFEIHARPLLP